MTVPVEEMAKERIRQQLHQLAEMAPQSIAAHATLLHRTDTGRPVVPQRHHLEWVRMLQDVENYRWLCVVAPPGYAKSTWFSVIYPSWRLGVTKGQLRIGLVSNTANLTYGFARAIQRTIEDEKFQQVYGVTPDKKRWSQVQAWTSGSIDAANPNLLASGIGGPLQGKRFDEIILDDPTTWDDARSEQTMENQRHWLRALLLQRFPPGMGPPDGQGRMVVVMTRWSERDLIPTLQDIGFKVITMPALGYWDGQNDPITGEFIPGEEPLWPEKESRQQLLAEREEDEIVFELVKQGNPRVLSGDVFDPANFKHAPMPKRSEFVQVIQYVDTAGGKDREKGDFFVDATIGLREGGEEVWVLDIERGRYPAPEQERKVIYEATEWEPDLVCIEDRNEGIALFQRLIHNTRLPLKAVAPQKDKEFRAIPLANAYRARKVFHPSETRWVRSYETELAAFPKGAHDDQVDAASGAYAHSSLVGPRIRVLKRSVETRRFL